MSQPIKKRLPKLVDEMRGGRRDLAATGGIALFVSAIGLLLAFWYIEPPPPSELKIAAGPQGGAYAALAERMSDYFDERGVQLTVLTTAGSVENYDLLLGDPDVRLAIVQGGSAPDTEGTERLESLATLFPEPLWIFFHRDRPIERIADLKGQRVALGEPGSGCRLLSSELLLANGVSANTSDTRLVELAPMAAAQRLRSGEVDAAFFVMSPTAPLITELLEDDRIHVLSVSRSAAYAQLYPALHDVVLPHGVIDLRRDLPDDDVHLVAPLASLVATPELHDAFIPLLLEAANASIEPGGRLSGHPNRPSLVDAEYPPNAVAGHYFKNGPPFLQRYLGFWLASLVDRAKIMIVPLIVLCIPAFKVWPPVYRWRIRSRIYRWYGLLRQIDQELRTGSGRDLDALRERLEAIEDELELVSVPLSYMEEFYNLRLHINLVLRRIEEKQQRRRPGKPLAPEVEASRAPL